MRNLYYLLKMARLSLPYKFRKYITIFLFLILGFFFFKSAFAVYDPNPKHSKWFHDSIVNDPLTKSAVEVKASRTYPVTVVDPASGAKNTITKTQRSIIKLTPSVSSVSRSLLKGGAHAAIGTALYAILDRAVEWVLDPENNSIKFKVEPEPTEIKPTDKKIWKAPPSKDYIYNSPEAAARVVCEYRKQSYGKPYKSNDWQYYVPCKRSDGSTDIWTVDAIANPEYDPDVLPEPQESSIPIDTVAQEVIVQANEGNGAALEVMTDAALDSLNAGEFDSQLESSADPKQFGSNESDPFGGSSPTPDPDPDGGTGTTPDGGTGTDTPSPEPEGESFQLPPFCSWATKVCDFIDWVKTEPPDDDGDGDIPVDQPDPDMHVGILERLYIDMPAACPPDPILEFMGAKIPFPMSIFCQFAEMMKPLILLFAYIKGLSIIGNGLT
ncbi:virulence factor TspB C-terminal domain-related protein [Psychrobacter sp. T6-5]|uniref:virulence factor TspB C-terminal domain-related protein n=1 Tax=Psychrobacter sp. T6-5 TaxID=3457451 RepID=UPI003FD4562C